MMMKKSMDEKDRRIISLVYEDPEISQEGIAQEVGLSQPSVAVRLKRLKEEGAIVASFGAEPLRMGLSLAKVDVVTTNTTKLLNAFEKCPYFLNGFIVSGEYNLCLFFVGESTSTLEAIVDHHIRSMDEVQKAIFNVIVESKRAFISPMWVNVEKHDRPPCSPHTDCIECIAYGKRCAGCPATSNYRGNLL
jgi:DNA-binding Lrp family transcriptional regulator